MNNIDPKCEVVLSGYLWNGTKTICPDIQIAGNRDFEKVELKCKKQCLTTHAITLTKNTSDNGMKKYTHVLTFGLDKPVLNMVSQDSKVSMLEEKEYSLDNLFQIQANPLVEQYLAQGELKKFCLHLFFFCNSNRVTI